MCPIFYTGHTRVIYREPNGILHAAHVFRYKSSLRSNFLVVKNKLHIFQRTPIFSEQFWLPEKGFEKFFVRQRKRIAKLFHNDNYGVAVCIYGKGLRSAWLPLWT